MPSRTRPRMLVVEDERIAAELIGLVFLRWKIDHLVASTVAEAKALLEMPFDLVVLDIMLPDGSGVEVLKTIRERGLTMPVMIWTALAPQDIPEAIALAPDYLLPKPASPDDIKAVANDVNAAFRSRSL